MVPKYPRTPYWPWSPSVDQKDKTHSDPEYFLNKLVVITEKIDGSNVCLHNGEVYARSTSQPSHNGWHAMVRKHQAWKTLQDCGSPRFYYGEDIFGVHSLEYEPVLENETYRLFAIRYFTDNYPGLESDIFMSWKQTEIEASLMEMKTVPCLFSGIFKSTKEITEFFESQLYNSILGKEAEGFVMRIADKFEAKDFSKNVCKFVRPNHVQTDEHWTKNWKSCRLKK